MSMEPTILSLEGWMELMEEMSNPPADTPERRATFERVRMIRKARQRPETRDSPGTRSETRQPIGVSVIAIVRRYG